MIMDKKEVIIETKKHIKEVEKLLFNVIRQLENRAIEHDLSKFRKE